MASVCIKESDNIGRMGKPKYFLLVAIIAAIVIMVNQFSKKPEEKVLGLISPTVVLTPTTEPSVIVPSASPSAEPMATPSAMMIAEEIMATPTATPTKKPTLTPTKVAPTPTASLSVEVSGFVDRFSAQYGVDPNVIRYVAICESGYRSNAANGPYVGLFQFGAETWKNVRKEMGEETAPDLRYSAEESIQTAGVCIV